MQSMPRKDYVLTYNWQCFVFFCSTVEKNDMFFRLKWNLKFDEIMITVSTIIVCLYLFPRLNHCPKGQYVIKCISATVLYHIHLFDLFFSFPVSYMNANFSCLICQC